VGGVTLGQALDDAFDHLDAFCAVQRAEHGTLTIDGVQRLQEAVGIDDVDRTLLLERLPGLTPDANRGSVLLGVLLGLFAADALGDP
jgi:hypothetical protein